MTPVICSEIYWRLEIWKQVNVHFWSEIKAQHRFECSTKKKQIFIELYVLIIDVFFFQRCDTIWCGFSLHFLQTFAAAAATLSSLGYYCSLLVGAVMQFYICSSMCVCTIYIHVSVCVVIGALNAWHSVHISRYIIARALVYLLWMWTRSVNPRQ